MSDENDRHAKQTAEATTVIAVVLILAVGVAVVAGVLWLLGSAN